MKVYLDKNFLCTLLGHLDYQAQITVQNLEQFQGVQINFEEIIGVPMPLPQLREKPKPSYKELITARELD
ncbi:MAG: hypothetical protein Ct9H90mP6_10570 [Gammaproteobacteria bacterium]|nr:MAG: hypothetical protein Ct9H90mP6_10570 [Gammaproteobacteria bacterium]